MSDNFTVNNISLTLSGTASWANNAQTASSVTSASYALTASFAPNSGGSTFISNMAVFSSSVTWSVPIGVTQVRAIVVGGGGRASNPTQQPSGNGGGYCEGLIQLTGTSSIGITVGGERGTSQVGNLIATGGDNGGGNPGFGSGGLINASGSPAAPNGSTAIGLSGFTAYYGAGSYDFNKSAGLGIVVFYY